MEIINHIQFHFIYEFIFLSTLNSIFTWLTNRFKNIFILENKSLFSNCINKRIHSNNRFWIKVHLGDLEIIRTLEIFIFNKLIVCNPWQFNLIDIRVRWLNTIRIEFTFIYNGLAIPRNQVQWKNNFIVL